MKQFFNQTSSSTTVRKKFEYCPVCGTKFISENMGICSKCNFIQYHNPLPAISVIIKNDVNEILVGKRKSASESWCLPCGYIEQNENFLEAAHREVKEETNITIRIDAVINIVSNVLKDDLESLVIVLLAAAITTDASPGDDLIELRWCNVDNLPKMEFDADVYIIGAYFQKEFSRIIVDPRYRMLS